MKVLCAKCGEREIDDHNRPDLRWVCSHCATAIAERRRQQMTTTVGIKDGALERIGWMIFSLIYLWMRDSGLPLTPETGEYMLGHFTSLKLTTEMRFSNDDLVDFIYEYLGDQTMIERREE